MLIPNLCYLPIRKRSDVEEAAITLDNGRQHHSRKRPEC